MFFKGERSILQFFEIFNFEIQPALNILGYVILIFIIDNYKADSKNGTDRHTLDYMTIEGDRNERSSLDYEAMEKLSERETNISALFRKPKYFIHCQ